jgi:hypothetical protein
MIAFCLIGTQILCPVSPKKSAMVSEAEVLIVVPTSPTSENILQRLPEMTR